MKLPLIAATAPLGCQSPLQQVYIYEAQTGQPFLVVDTSVPVGTPPTIVPASGWTVSRVGDPAEQGWMCTPSTPGSYTVNGSAITVVAATPGITTVPVDPATMVARSVFSGLTIDGTTSPKWNNAVPPAPAAGVSGLVFRASTFTNCQFCGWSSFPGARFFGCRFINCQFSNFPYNWHFDNCVFTGPLHSMILGPAAPGQDAITNCTFRDCPRGFVWQFKNPETLSGYFVQHNHFVRVGGPWREGIDECMAGESGATNSQCVLANSVIADNFCDHCTGPLLQLFEMRGSNLLVTGNWGSSIVLTDPPGAIGATYTSCTFTNNRLVNGRVKASQGCQGLLFTGNYIYNPGPLSSELTLTPAIVPPVFWLPVGGGNRITNTLICGAPASMATCNDMSQVDTTVIRWQ